MHINFYFQFQCVHCESVFFYNIKLISQKSNQVILLARFFLQRLMFIKFISTLPERLKKYENMFWPLYRNLKATFLPIKILLANIIKVATAVKLYITKTAFKSITLVD